MSFELGCSNWEKSMAAFLNRIILVVLAIAVLGAATTVSAQTSSGAKKQLEDCAKKGGTC